MSHQELQCHWMWQGARRAPRSYMNQFAFLMWVYLWKEKKFSTRARAQKKTPEISILVIGRRHGKKFNLRYRDKKYATDVLSFPGEGFFGDLVLCDQVIFENARARKVPYREELGYVFLHGVLHLFGFDHETSVEDEREMLGLQDRVFNKIMKALGSKSRVLGEDQAPC